MEQFFFGLHQVIMIFCYSSIDSVTPTIWPILWHVGAIMTCLGGYWFWFFLRVDVYSEAQVFHGIELYKPIYLYCLYLQLQHLD